MPAAAPRGYDDTAFVTEEANEPADFIPSDEPSPARSAPNDEFVPTYDFVDDPAPAETAEPPPHEQTRESEESPDWLDRLFSRQKGKTGRKRRRAGSIGIVSAIWIATGVATLLAMLVAFISLKAMIVIVVLFMAAGFAILLAAQVWILVVAFQESVGCGLMVLFLPVYPIYYVVSRWENTRQPFLTFFAGAGMVIMPFIGVNILVGAHLIKDPSASGSFGPGIWSSSPSGPVEPITATLSNAKAVREARGTSSILLEFSADYVIVSGSVQSTFCFLVVRSSSGFQWEMASAIGGPAHRRGILHGVETVAADKHEQLTGTFECWLEMQEFGPSGPSRRRASETVSMQLQEKGAAAAGASVK